MIASCAPVDSAIDDVDDGEEGSWMVICVCSRGRRGEAARGFVDWGAMCDGRLRVIGITSNNPWTAMTVCGERNEDDRWWFGWWVD